MYFFRTQITPRQHIRLTLSSISLVCAADRQKRARDSIIGVAGNPTTTVARPSDKHSLLNALKGKESIH